MASEAAVARTPRAYNQCECGAKKTWNSKVCRSCWYLIYHDKCKCGRYKVRTADQCFRCNQRDGITQHDRRIEYKEHARLNPIPRLKFTRFSLPDDCPDCKGFCYKQDNIGWYVCHTCLGSGSSKRKGDREGGTYVRRNDERNDPASIHRRLAQQK